MWLQPSPWVYAWGMDEKKKPPALRSKTCAALTREQGKCPFPALPRSEFCTIHRAVMAPAGYKVHHQLYATKIEPRAQELYKTMIRDKDLFSIHHELAVYKSYFILYLEKCAEAKVIPDPKALSLFIETMRRCMETEHNKKYQLTVAGVQALIETMTDVLYENLEDQPEVLMKIVQHIRSITIEPDHLQGGPTVRQLQRTPGAASIIDDRLATG